MTAQFAHDLIALNSGPVTPVLSRAIRPMLVSGPGKRLIGGDFSGIEARVSAWMADETWKLQAFRDYDAGIGTNLYIVAYSRAFGVPTSDIRKGSTEYDIGKKAELACIAEGQLVHTNNGDVPIEKVLLEHKVWDGFEFVEHGGVVARGEKEVIRYDGLVATPDHQIFSTGDICDKFEDLAHGGYIPSFSKRTLYCPVMSSRMNTYDILDCGPRNSFVVSGWRVHNCGYQGSVGAYLRFSPDVRPITKTVMSKFYKQDVWLKAAEQYERANNRYGLSADQWISVKVIVNAWREANPKIVQSWWDRQDAAIAAVDAPGSRQDVCGGRVAYMVADGFLWCRLPTGKLIGYCRPRLIETKEDYLIDANGEMFPADEFLPEELEARVAAGGVIREGRKRVQVQFDGVNQKTRRWGSQRLYGGLQCNNDVQGAAREILAGAMFRVEEAGYPVVLHVHDELVAEVEQEFGSPKEFESLMAILASCFKGLPLVAKAWASYRYIK